MFIASILASSLVPNIFFEFCPSLVTVNWEHGFENQNKPNKHLLVRSQQ